MAKKASKKKAATKKAATLKAKNTSKKAAVKKAAKKPAKKKTEEIPPAPAASETTAPPVDQQVTDAAKADVVVQSETPPTTPRTVEELEAENADLRKQLGQRVGKPPSSTLLFGTRRH